MYYKVGQVLLQDGAAFLYYKPREVVLQSKTGAAKWDGYHKVGKLIQCREVHASYIVWVLTKNVYLPKKLGALWRSFHHIILLYLQISLPCVAERE